MRSVGRIAMLLWSVSAVIIRAEESVRVVAADGSGQFQSVQAAVDSIPEGNTEPHVIVIKPGTYREQVAINGSRPFITLRGADGDARKTVISFNRYATIEDPKARGKRIGVFGTETMSITAHHFLAENITFENTAGRLAPGIAVRADGDKVVFRNCRFLGWQDTLFLGGKRAYLHDCYVEGRVDFICGSATAVFDHCHLYALDGGVMVAASTKAETPFGFVFLKCKIGCKEDRSYLGAPWQPGAAIAFIECELGENLWPEGWTEWRGETHHKSARFVEYNSTGPGAHPEKRPPWVRLLTDAEAKSYTVENILGGTDGWHPHR